jgi:dipeptidase E
VKLYTLDMKFLLTSAYSNVADELPKLLNEKPEEVTVAFIATAADVYEDKWFVEVDRNKLIGQGFKIRDVSLASKGREELEKEIEGCGVIFVAGGNTFYLLQQVRKSGFDEILKKVVATNVVYVGSSAGSIVVTPTIAIAGMEPGDENIPGLTDLTGLGFVDFEISPHTPEIVSHMSNQKYRAASSVPLYQIDNHSAVCVENDEVKVVGDGKW